MYFIKDWERRMNKPELQGILITCAGKEKKKKNITDD